MRRREFIAGLGGTATWPLIARAQQAMPVIGFLHSASPSPFAAHVASFRRGLGEAGYVEGQNVTIEYRWAEGRFDRLGELVDDLVRRRVSVVTAPGSTVAAIAAKAATTVIPIVFGIGDDPVKFGLVASLARPGGNATGINFFTVELIAKRLGLLRELVPNATRVAVLVNPSNTTNAEATVRDSRAAAPALGLQVLIFNASTNDAIDTAFASLARERVDALFVGPDSFFNGRRVQLATLAARHVLPTAFSVRDYVEAGGHAGCAVDQVRTGDQPQDRQGARPHRTDFAARARRRGDRMKRRMSGVGTTRTAM